MTKMCIFLGGKFHVLCATCVHIIQMCLNMFKMKTSDFFLSFKVSNITLGQKLREIWCHINVHMQLYAYMTLIYENIIKKPKNVPKMWFLELKCAKNDISKFDMMLCLGIQNHVKIVLTWFFYQTASFGIIVQKSSIGQKFRPLRAHLKENIWWPLENTQKNS